MKKKRHEREELITSLRKNLLTMKQENDSLLEKLKLVALDGDFTENADWTALNEEKEKLQREIRLLEKKIKRLEVNHEMIKSQIITYQLLATQEKMTVELTDNTDESEIDPSRRKISRTSPLGLALINKKPGEISEVKAPSQNYKIKILQIK